jgi:hypothetical protein
MNTITCTNCGQEIEIDKALEGQIETRVLNAERHKHAEELAKVTVEQEARILKERTAASEFAKKQLEGEKELLRKQAEADLEHEKKKLLQDAANEQRKKDGEQESLIKTLREDAENAKEDTKELTRLMQTLREEKRARDNAELEAQKKLAAGEEKIREETLKTADEKYHLKMMEKDKQIADTQKALDDAQRKAAQGSQQNQGEVLELDLENRLREGLPRSRKVPEAPISNKPSATSGHKPAACCCGKPKTASGSRPGYQNSSRTSVKPQPILASSYLKRSLPKWEI